jgi:hypothetical protein
MKHNSVIAGGMTGLPVFSMSGGWQKGWDIHDALVGVYPYMLVEIFPVPREE